MKDDVNLLEQKLSSFDSEERANALASLVSGLIAKEEPESENLNLHFHSFYSYNAEGWSPSRIAWEAKKARLFAAGIVDFDVLDGMSEFLIAGETLSLRACVGVETRTYFAKFANEEIDSPGEPGVNYAMGVGFVKDFEPESFEAQKLRQFRDNARKRNLSLIKRINEKLKEIAIDYDKEVLPLTPSGNATERHIVEAYIRKSFEVFKDAEKRFAFFSEILGKSPNELKQLFESSRPAFDELVRAKFAKKGGIGYIQPDSKSFPPLKEFLDWVRKAGAIPTEAWLDGTSGAESKGFEYLEASCAEGAEALNIIPDRNWNIKDEKTKSIKIAKLDEIISAAEKLHMPIFIGTEMNKSGQPFADDINCEALRKYKNIFIKGAAIAIGHSILMRFASFSYSGPKSAQEFKSKKDKNSFFEAVGNLPALGVPQSRKLLELSNEHAFEKIADSAKAKIWLL